MLKLASLETTEVKDSKTGKEIRVSTTARLIYRKAYPNEYGSMRNHRLNMTIAKDFVNNAGNVLHYFRLGKKESPRHEYKPVGSGGDIYANVAEIRGTSSSFFISAIKENTIDILTIQTSWLKPKYKGSHEEPIALGDS